MTIAEKLLRGKRDLDDVHAAGYNAGYAKGQAEGGGGGSGIITVPSLPTENIDKNAVYRLAPLKMYVVYEEDIVDLDVPCAVVDTLPSNPFDEGNADVIVWIISSTGIGYISLSEDFAEKCTVAEVLGEEEISVTDRGWIDDIHSIDPTDETQWGVYACISVDEESLYVYKVIDQHGEWIPYVKYEDEDEATIAEIWDAIQGHGDRWDYSNYFDAQSAWTKRTFRPIYDINVVNGQQMFMGAFQSENEPVDLVELLNEQGVILNMDRCEAHNSVNWIWNANISHLGKLHTEMLQMASSAYKLVRIDEVEIRPGVPGIPSDHVYRCYNLSEITFTGTFTDNVELHTLNKISVSTMKSAISCLQSGQDYTHTISFPSSKWDELEASGPSPNGGTWEEYIYDLGWLKG